MTTTAMNTLLSQSLEVFQTININEKTIVISVLDSFDIGKNTDFGQDRSQDSIWIFAENLILADSFKIKEGIVSTYSLTVSGNGLFDVSGKAGTSNITINQDKTNKGEQGGNGDNSGNLSLYLELANLEKPTFNIAAKGGDGGAGQQGINSSTGTDGGDGGDGGNGGKVVILVGLPYLQWVSQLKSIYQMSSFDTQKQALNDILGIIPEEPVLSNLRQILNNAVSSSTEEEFKKSRQKVEVEFYKLVNNFKNEPLINISGGKYGVYGEGNKNGKSGHSGSDGSLTFVPFGVPNELIHKDFTPFFFIHPSQCARLLEKIKLMYWTLDPVNKPQEVKDVMTLLLRLQARTKLFVDVKDGSGLVKFYNENESKFCAIESVNQLRSIYNETTNYLTLLKQGKDVFGYDSNHVPLASFNFYKDLLDELIENFRTLETYYKNYFDSLKSKKATIEQIKNARNQQQSVIINAESQNFSLQGIVFHTANIIDSYQTILPPLKQILNQKLKDLEEVIHSHFNFNFDTVFQSLTTLAFAPRSEFMILTQASEFLYNGVTNVTNDQGVPVQKEYIVNQIKSVQSDLKSLQESYQALDNGTLASDDPGAGKLVAEEQQLMNFFKSFYSQFPSELDELKKAFEAYISKILERNNQILTYNATVTLILKNKQMIDAAHQRQQELNDNALEQLAPDLPDLVTFVSSIYYSARNQIMEILDLTARAFRFWALSNTKLITEAYGNKTLPQINHLALVAAKNAILNEYQKAIENFGTNAQSFPKSEQSKLIFKVPSYQVNFFISTNQLMVKIPTVTRNTTKEENPFSGMANVRVRLVRVWIDGVKTSDEQLQIKITHTGKSQIRSQNDEDFSFSHEPISKIFKISNLVAKTIEEEANFGENQSNYATLSPFTSWNISVDPKYNCDLDLSKVTGVQIEFHGTNYAFNV